jgi:D-glycero-D-manno-heptose 1,7-bisphosphate phosphatase
MLLEAAARHALDLGRSWMIGDQDRDIAAGEAAGCQTILLGESPGNPSPDYVAGSMTEAAELISRSTKHD